MPDERPDSERHDASNDAPDPRHAPRGRVGKADRELSEPASDVFASWKDPPPVQPQELSSKVWAQEGPPSAEGDVSDTGASGREEKLPTLEPEQGSLAPPAGAEEPGPEAPEAPVAAFSELPERIEDVVETRIDEALTAGVRSVGASLGTALGRLTGSIEESVQTAVRSQLAAFVAEQGRVIRELRDAMATVERAVIELRASVSARPSAEDQLRDAVGAFSDRLAALDKNGMRALEAIDGVERAVEELKPRQGAPEPPTAAQVEEAFSRLRQQVGEVGPEVGRPLAELREAVLAKLAADDQVRDALAGLSERLGAFEGSAILAVEEPLRELRREVAHALGALSGRVETRLAELAANTATEREAIREAVAGTVERILGERLETARRDLAAGLSSEIAAAATTAQIASQEARFARSQLTQAVSAMERALTSGDETAE